MKQEIREKVEEIKELLKKKKYSNAYAELSKIDQDILYVHGEYDLLVSIYTQLLENGNLEDTTNAGIQAKLGRIYYRKGDLEKGKELLFKSSSVDNNPLKLFALSVLGGLLRDNGEKEEAKKILNKVIDLAKEENDLQIYAGSLVRKGMLILKDDLEEAKKLVEKAINIAEENKWERDRMIWKGYLIDIKIEEGDDIQDLLKEVLQLKKYFEGKNDVRYIEQQEEREKKLEDGI